MSPQTDNHSGRGFGAAIAAAAILSTTAIFIRYLSLEYRIPALVLAFWRDVFAVATILPILALAKPALLRVTRGQLGYLGLYGLVLSVFNALWTLSVAWNGAAVATVLVYCSGAFTAVLARVFLKERLSLPKLAAIALTIGGCVLVSDALTLEVWRTNLSGILAGVLAGLSYAVYSIMGRSASRRGLDPWTSLLYIFAVAAVFLALYSLGSSLVPGGLLPGAAQKPADFFWLGSSLAGWGVLFLLAAGPTVAGFGLYLVSLSHLPSSVANLVVSLEPAFTMVIAFLLLGERLGFLQVLGALAIMAGVLFLRIAEGGQAEAAKAVPAAG
jgi:drug/metabolite transporter (DMT)-like permease